MATEPKASHPLPNDLVWVHQYVNGVAVQEKVLISRSEALEQAAATPPLVSGLHDTLALTDENVKGAKAESHIARVAKPQSPEPHDVRDEYVGDAADEKLDKQRLDQELQGHEHDDLTDL